MHKLLKLKSCLEKQHMDGFNLALVLMVLIRLSWNAKVDFSSSNKLFLFIFITRSALDVSIVNVSHVCFLVFTK